MLCPCPRDLCALTCRGAFALVLFRASIYGRMRLCDSPGWTAHSCMLHVLLAISPLPTPDSCLLPLYPALSPPSITHHLPSPCIPFISQEANQKHTFLLLATILKVEQATACSSSPDTDRCSPIFTLFTPSPLPPPPPPPQEHTDLLLAAILTPILAVAALAAFLVLLSRKRLRGAAGGARAPKATAAKREPPGVANKQITLVLTDVQVGIGDRGLA